MSVGGLPGRGNSRCKGPGQGVPSRKELLWLECHEGEKGAGDGQPGSQEMREKGWLECEDGEKLGAILSEGYGEDTVVVPGLTE